jgi:hypothetical protein
MTTEEAPKSQLPADLSAIRDRIERWRETRVKRTHMPEDLWQAAANAARTHGTWRVSQSLRVRYEGLRSRIAAPESQPTVEPVAQPTSPPGFVDMTPARTTSGARPTAPTTIELTRPDGARLSLRLGSSDIDPHSWIQAFFGGCA